MSTLSVLLLLVGILAGLATHHVYNRAYIYSERRLELKTHCMRQLGGEYVTALLFADPGDFSGSAEAKHILANLRDKREVPGDSTVCGSRYTGTLMGQDVAVITTGIGDTAAGLCAYEVLLTCGAHVKEIIYFGTSGWSPAKGGLLDADSCGTANKQPDITRLGDVCVSPFSVDWVCKKASWSQQCAGYPNVCYLPQEMTGPGADYLYGRCIFTSGHKHSLKLADELLAAASSGHARNKAPRRVAAIQSDEEQYWALMSNGTTGEVPALPAGAAPRLWDYRHCSEVDGRFFYSGVPYEMLSREYVAHTINQGLNFTVSKSPKELLQSSSPLSISRAPNVTRSDVIAVAAMEGVGLAEAVLKYNMLGSTERAVPFTNVRAMSNWLHQPLQQVAPGNWTYGQEVPEDFQHGYSYAIATGSNAILALFSQRCRDRQLGNAVCTYHVDYPEAAADSAAATAVGPVTSGKANVQQSVRSVIKLGKRMPETSM